MSENFSEIREGNYFYVDKTHFIKKGIEKKKIRKYGFIFEGKNVLIAEE